MYLGSLVMRHYKTAILRPKGRPNGTAVGRTPCGGSIHGGTNRSGVFRSDESIGGGSFEQMAGKKFLYAKQFNWKCTH